MSGSTANTVASRLNMTSNVPEVIAQMVRGFGLVNSEIKATQGNLAGREKERRL